MWWPTKFTTIRAQQFQSRVFRETRHPLGLKKTRTTPIHRECVVIAAHFNQHERREASLYLSFIFPTAPPSTPPLRLHLFCFFLVDYFGILYFCLALLPTTAANELEYTPELRRVLHRAHENFRDNVPLTALQKIPAPPLLTSK